MEAKWERARTDEQKEQRIAEIISATEKLYKKYSYKDITFVLIAGEANFTRSNLYKYFGTKEEIFLEFLIRDFIKWRKSLLKTVGKNKRFKVREFAELWVKILMKHKRLLELLSIMFIHLESNVSVERYIEFKFEMKSEMDSVSELLCRLFPRLTPENAEEFIYLQASSAVGLYQMTDYKDFQLEALKHPELCRLKADFEPLYISSVEYIMKGLLEPA